MIKKFFIPATGHQVQEMAGKRMGITENSGRRYTRYPGCNVFVDHKHTWRMLREFQKIRKLTRATHFADQARSET
jgi:hypothetical protein